MKKLTNIGQLVTCNSDTNNIETLSNVEMLIENDRIVSIAPSVGNGDETIDCQHKLVTPGFVDPHTHPVFFDGRDEEYSLRLSGATYEEIAEKGGGIRSSISGVQNASENELMKRVIKRMNRFLHLGTTTIEAKSGYGLDTESELKSLRVLDRVNKEHPIDIVPTFLGAHAFPPEFADNHDGYVDLLCDEMITAVAEQGIAKYCDVFCENGYFTVEQSRRILETAKKHGLIPRLHADEFEDSGAAELAAEVGAVSADHLMAVSDAGITALKDGNVTATLLPGTTFYLGKQSYAPANKLTEAGIPIALATDFNPGSSHLQSMPFMISLACLYLGMSVEEAFKAATWQSAVTLGMEHEVGSIEVGKKADLVIWDLARLIEIPYFSSDVPMISVMKTGNLLNL
ncbi:MAG: imidazolonepropionase [Candidatus Marinimicrobia bacterium]|nr:imidazolonepropionase [Candidatus Neomarinimicrobiota bacterium]MBL7059568.1 imidazolonepropionase [Candidatus Neomarinimicrobiota bacterium]